MPDMKFTGTREECDAFVAGQLGRYPTAGYGTSFNWPPGKTAPNGKPLSHNLPTDHGDGRWTIRGWRLASCD